jgi:hypothetical protein
MPFDVYDRENGRGRLAAGRFCGLSDVCGSPGWVWVAIWPSGALTWSGRVRPRWRAGRRPQGQPLVCAVPGLGQVQPDVPVAVPGGAGGDVDEVAADGGAAGLGVGEAGQGSGGAQRVMRDRGAGQPGRVGGEESGWQVRQRPVGPVGEDLLDDRVVSVLGLGLDQLDRGIGEYRVVAPDGEQFVLPAGLFWSRTRRTISRAVTCWPFFAEVKAV